MGTNVARQARAENPESNYKSTVTMVLLRESKNLYYQVRNIFNNDRAPGFTMYELPSQRQRNRNSLLTSVPMLSKYAGYSTVKDVSYERLVVKFKNPSDSALIEAFLKDCKNAQYYLPRVDNFNDKKETFDQVTTILDMIFNVIISITMLICFFSLSSSMSANLYESAKEIGILRATGLTRYQIEKLYIYEAFVLVMSSCMLGILIGTVVGFTMTL